MVSKRGQWMWANLSQHISGPPERNQAPGGRQMTGNVHSCSSTCTLMSRHADVHYCFLFLPRLQIEVCFRPNFTSCLWGTHSLSLLSQLINTFTYWHDNNKTCIAIYIFNNVYMSTWRQAKPYLQLVDLFLGKRDEFLSNLSSLILQLTHVYQTCDPHCYLGNQTGSVGGQGFQVLLLSSLRFPLVALQEQTQQQQRLITTWYKTLQWPSVPCWLMRLRFWQSWLRWKKQCKKLPFTTFRMHLLHNYQVKENFSHLPESDAFEKFASWKSNSARNEMSGKILHNNMKIEVKQGARACLSLCSRFLFLVFFSIKTVAHLLIRADVAANHSDERERKQERERENKRTQNSFSKKAILNCLNEPQMMRWDREFKLMSSHVTHGLCAAAAAFFKQQTRVAESPPSNQYRRLRSQHFNMEEGSLLCVSECSG